MRGFVVLFEFLIFVPGYLRLINHFPNPNVQKYKYEFLMAVMVIPPIVFVDHGHFQFNQVMHGFVLWAISFMFEGQV